MPALAELSLPIRWVRTNAELQQACDQWTQLDALVIDTEFVRRRTFYPIPALLQFFDGDTVVVVDPVAISDWVSLTHLLLDPGVLKVFHACSEDLEVFWRLLGAIPAPLFDTQIAAGLCGLRPSMGYHKLVMALCDVDLPKDETNSDWLARPLSENQLQYAAYDVYYLHLIYRHLSDLAMDKGRFDWVLQDGAAMGATLSTLIAPEQYYVKLKGAQRLSLRELAIARALCSWRERMARSANLPRSWVLKDSAIVSLARMQPRDEQQLVQVRDLPPATARKQGQRLLKEIQQALELPPQQWPPALPEQLQAGDKRKLAQIQQVVNGCAEQLSLAPELLMNRKQIVEATLRLLAGTQPVLPPDIDQWRRRLLEPPLQELAPV